ncbi:steroid delta-isomerase [Rasiella rasia]|uniref:Steroid delta-isomerase n=1 Tax=Rasiella rasia TaxID=2744027 RepID=A0A6G6GQC1_9FLAO|nr:nuclear transport factor 2 family protein [Rasiella rasia]QIE60737.1 steroid delta-isomerase [Rasiella rasia]
MKAVSLIPIFSLLFSLSLIAQPNTDVFLLDVAVTDSTFTVANFQNISNGSGYDNQPHFLDNNKVLYAGSEDGQTEIQMYYISEKTKHRVNAKTAGGEYSPMPYPNKNKITAVRLDTTGLQRLYAYDYTNPGFGDYEMLLSELEIAYYAFYDENFLVASILSGGQLDLIIADIKKDQATLYAENSGRSIHKVPNSDSVSYTIVNEEKNHDVYLVDVNNAEETYFVCQLPTGIQDHAWLDASTLVIGSGSKLYTYSLFDPARWVEVADFSANNIENITRIAVSPDKKHIAFAAEKKQPSPASIVDVHIKPFNEANLDLFANAFAENVLVSRFPSDTISVGRDQLKSSYANFYKNNESWHVEVKNRIVLNNYVIDEEVATVNGRSNRQVTVYETKNGLIQTMTFIGNKKADDPLPPVLAQMEAYNNRDIDAFMQAYGDTIKTYNFPNKLRTAGHDTMKVGFTKFFENTPDLHYTVPNRMVIGNIVIDEELITANGTQFSAIAIYEICDGKICAVTFLQ